MLTPQEGLGPCRVLEPVSETEAEKQCVEMRASCRSYTPVHREVLIDNWYRCIADRVNQQYIYPLPRHTNRNEIHNAFTCLGVLEWCVIQLMKGCSEVKRAGTKGPSEKSWCKRTFSWFSVRFEVLKAVEYLNVFLWLVTHCSPGDDHLSDTFMCS